MKINILEFAEGARRATGLTVIIDVFRAFSVACYALDAGAISYITCSSVEEAFNLKKKYRKAILIGERNERKIEGFDLGNSPTEILTADLDDRIVIHTTTAGTMGLANARAATQLVTGSLVNAGSVIEYIKRTGAKEVSLVAMGYRGETSADEDLLCAEIIAAGLRNETTDFTKRIAALKDGPGKRFFLPENIEFSPPSDFFLCTMADRFSFVIKATPRHDGNIDLTRIDL